MYYFAKFNKDGEIDSISISDFKTEVETENEYYVDEETCLKLKAQMAEKIALENAAIEAENQDYIATLENTIADLEAENAALLFQTLTGEEFIL